MRKPRIFIASSGKAKGGAIDLRDQLKATSLFSDVYLWSDVFPLQGEVTIGILRRYAEECDFFAGFFTEDDVVVRRATNFALLAITVSSRLACSSARWAST